MEYISLPKSEYNKLTRELSLLKDKKLMNRVNEIIDLMYESKYGIYLGDFTSDLTELTISNIKEWEQSGDIWNEV